MLFIKLYEGAKDDLRTYQSAVEQAQKQVEADNERLAKDQERILADYGQRWAAAVAHRPAVRVRNDTGCVGQVPTLPATPGVHAQLPASGDQARDISVEQCERIANDSILDAVWIEQVKRLTNELHEASR
jgi:hypothetical protein